MAPLPIWRFSDMPHSFVCILHKSAYLFKSLWVRTGVACALAATFAMPAHADTKIILGTSWFAEAEQGGFYQALATGIYKKYGLDVSIKMGGPQVNGIQLLAGGAINLWTGYDFQTVRAIEKGVPVVTVAAFFQKDPQAILAHPGINSPAELKGHTLYISSGSETTYWPWFKNKYQLSDSQIRPYLFSVVPFLANPQSAQEGYVTSEPFAMEKGGVTPSILLLANYGYPPYSATLVAMQSMVKQDPSVIQRFIEASSEGWKSYFANPAPGNALIKKANPAMTDQQIAFSIAQMKKYGIVMGGDASTKGIGIMTNKRWKETDEVMVKTGLLPASFNYHQAYTLQFMKNLALPSASQ